jgi:hypothetical protein
VAVAAELLSPLAAGVAARLEGARADGGTGPEPGSDPEPALRHGGALAQRMIGYLGQLLAVPGEVSRHVSP